jgi:hypothetical protein
MKKKIQTSHWRTTLGGVLSAVGPILTLCPIPYASLIGGGLSALGGALVGINAADKQKTVSVNDPSPKP